MVTGIFLAEPLHTHQHDVPTANLAAEDLLRIGCHQLLAQRPYLRQLLAPLIVAGSRKGQRVPERWPLALGVVSYFSDSNREHKVARLCERVYCAGVGRLSSHFLTHWWVSGVERL